MSATAAVSTETLPQGTWQLDPVHSSASFAIKHMIVATFRGRFENFDASLTVAEDGATQLTGTVDTSSIVVKDENLAAHLQSPDFFDVERYPELRFESTAIRLDGDQVEIDGELTIRDQTHPVVARGSWYGPAVTLGDVEKVGITLETVIDRTQFGLDWNAPLPKGGVALADEVKLTVELELVGAEA